MIRRKCPYPANGCLLAMVDNWHPQEYEHRVTCPIGSISYCPKSSDADHMENFFHRNECYYNLRNCEISKVSMIHNAEYIHQDEMQPVVAPSPPPLTVCRHEFECLEQHDSIHCSRYSHPYCKPDCSKGSNCDQTGDDQHKKKYYHPCKYDTTCKNTTQAIHLLRFKHSHIPVPNPATLRNALNNGQIPPPLPPPVTLPTTPKPAPTPAIRLPPRWQQFAILLADKSQLINPLTHWLQAPKLNTTLRDQEKVIVYGEELISGQSGRYKTGNIVILGSNNLFRVVSARDVIIPNNLTTPWSQNEILVWRCPNIIAAVNKLRTQVIAGTSVTFGQVFTTLQANGYVSFLIGGTIRDTLQDQNRSINDVDIGFSGCCHDIENVIRQTFPQAPLMRTIFGRVAIGSPHQSTPHLEGKPLNGINCDISETSSPKSLSLDFIEDLITRDFTIGSLWYDLKNDIVIDPSGIGISDVIQKFIRIPVKKNLWDKWWQGNPTKLLRYWKMISYGFFPVDNETKQFIISTTTTNYGGKLSPSDCKRFSSFFTDKNKLQKFKNAIDADMGVGWGDKIVNGK